MEQYKHIEDVEQTMGAPECVEDHGASGLGSEDVDDSYRDHQEDAREPWEQNIRRYKDLG